MFILSSKESLIEECNLKQTAFSGLKTQALKWLKSTRRSACKNILLLCDLAEAKM